MASLGKQGKQTYGYNIWPWEQVLLVAIIPKDSSPKGGLETNWHLREEPEETLVL